MASRREQIMAYIAAQVATITSVGGRVYRSRVEMLDSADTPAVVISPIGEQATYENTVHIHWTLTFRAVVYQRGTTPDSLADPIINDVYKKIMADRGLGGLALDIAPSSFTYTMDDGDKPIFMGDLQFTVNYRTLATDLES